MTCEEVREQVSARLDGETTAVADSLIDAHLATCAECHVFAERAVVLHRRMRLLEAPRVGDVSAGVAAAIDADAHSRRRLWRSWQLTRATLGGIGAAQLLLAVPVLLFGHDEQAPTHVAHEVGSFALAIAIGMLLAAWRPRLSAGMLPIIGIIAGLLLITAGSDLAFGRTQLSDEWPHLFDVAGFLLLWRLAKVTQDPSGDAGWSTAPTVDADEPHQASPRSDGVPGRTVADARRAAGE